MSEDQIKIGQLLVRAGVVSDGQMNQRVDLARQLGLPLGQILLQSKDIGRDQLLSAIQVQSLVLEGLISLDTAVEIIRRIYKTGATIDDALSKEGIAKQHLTHRLGELLVASGYLSEEGLAWALLTAGEIGVPLGHVLIQTGVVVPDIVGLALTTQRQIRMKAISVDEAIDRLKNYHPTASAS
ncbi:MAG TPA: hypothetical protein V6D22_05555 [Candidatus Obscuribacterales bacterium]